MSTRVRKLTNDEARAVHSDVGVRASPEYNAAKMAALKKAYETSTDIERYRHLLGALQLCKTMHPLPTWVYEGLQKLLIARLPAPNKIWVRWMVVFGTKRAVRE